MGSNKRGFTLVELLTVITIIAALAAFIFPAIRSSVTRAKKTRCRANIDNLTIAINGYYNDFGAYPDYPKKGTSGDPPRTDAGTPEVDNDVILRILRGRYWDGNKWVNDDLVRDSQRWNGPYIELKETKDFAPYDDVDQSQIKNTGGSDRRFFTDGWRSSQSKNKGKYTVYRFKFPGTRLTGGGEPHETAGPTFNVDSFDIWSGGPDGKENYYESDESNARKTYQDQPGNKDNIENWE